MFNVNKKFDMILFFHLSKRKLNENQINFRIYFHDPRDLIEEKKKSKSVYQKKKSIVLMFSTERKKV